MSPATKTAAVCAALGVGIVYLSAQALTGRQGLFAYMQLQQEERALTLELAELKAQRTALDARADRMRPGALDLDYLEERARDLLAAGKQDELVFALDGA